MHECLCSFVLTAGVMFCLYVLVIQSNANRFVAACGNVTDSIISSCSFAVTSSTVDSNRSHMILRLRSENKISHRVGDRAPPALGVQSADRRQEPLIQPNLAADTRQRQHKQWKFVCT